MPLAEIAPNKTNDDLSQVEENIEVLYSTYLRPIDRIRSKALPILDPPSPNDIETDKVENYLIKDFKEINIDVSKSLESRAHAFFRSLGMPVVTAEDGFYSPGFNPNQEEIKSRASVISSFYKNKELVNFIYEREKKISENQFIFSDSTSELITVVYSLISRYTFPFAVINTDKEDHLAIDKQNIETDSRDLFLYFFKIANPDYSSEIDSYAKRFKNIFHPIKPFVVDPRIENVVTPAANKICVPFLKTGKNSDRQNDLLRPGLEGIIRMRLKDSELDSDYLKNIENILKNNNKNKATTTIDYQTLSVSVAALMEDSKIPDDFKSFTQDKIKGVSALQFNMIVVLTKTIKSLVKQLLESQKLLDEVNISINWVPVPPKTGPETSIGWSISKTFYGLSLEKDFKIKELKLKKITSENLSKDFEKLGEFAFPFIKNESSEYTKNFDKELKKLEQYNLEVSEKGFLALRDIEIIKGESAGFGLIDVLAVYYGLFSMDIKHLLNLIDDSSVFRMWENVPEFRGISSVSQRFDTSAGSKEVLDALFELEKKVFFILDFADKYYEECLTTKNSTDSSA
jgi:hypothetical protein